MSRSTATRSSRRPLGTSSHSPTRSGVAGTAAAAACRSAPRATKPSVEQGPPRRQEAFVIQVGVDRCEFGGQPSGLLGQQRLPQGQAGLLVGLTQHRPPPALEVTTVSFDPKSAPTTAVYPAHRLPHPRLLQGQGASNRQQTATGIPVAVALHRADENERPENRWEWRRVAPVLGPTGATRSLLVLGGGRTAAPLDGR